MWSYTTVRARIAGPVKVPVASLGCTFAFVWSADSLAAKLNGASLRRTLRSPTTTPPRLHARDHQSLPHVGEVLWRVWVHTACSACGCRLTAINTTNTTALPTSSDYGEVTTIESPSLRLSHSSTTSVCRSRHRRAASSFNARHQNHQTSATFARLRRAVSDHTPQEVGHRQPQCKSSTQREGFETGNSIPGESM
jgi:hypothetical protein